MILIFIGKLIFKNPITFRIYANFEPDIEIDDSGIGNKTTKIYKKNPVPIGYHIEVELDGVLQSSYYRSPLGYDSLDWFVNEVKKLEKKRAFYFKKTKKDYFMTEKDEEECRSNNICRF